MASCRLPDVASMPDIHHDKILILDFGAQYTQLIARRIRDIGVYCEIWAYDCEPEQIRTWGAQGIILSGGPESTVMGNAPQIPSVVLTMDIPILGICYGMQILAKQLGGDTQATGRREFGHAHVTVMPHDRLLGAIAQQQQSPKLQVWMSHGDHVCAVPPDFVITASTSRIPIAAMAHQSRHWYGVQFHPEVTHTEQGTAILRRFVVDLCGCQTLWTSSHIIDDQLHRIRQQVGSDAVILGLSGGVDSSVVAALIHRAIGDQLTGVFVDTGLLRLGEGDQVMALFAEHLGMRIIRVNAAQRFFQALKGVTDPEQKRQVIGRLFVQIFEEESAQQPRARWLAQGTIYPDIIESAGSQTGKAQVIKSHHNVGGLPAQMRLRLLEPLRELFKDEVRRLGTVLGLPSSMIDRHPFPGPGLGVRILGEVRPDYIEILVKADAIFIDELRKHAYYDKVSQAFAVFLPVRSVGVVGDARAYEWVIALRAVETVDFMTARWAQLPYALLATVSSRIINEIPHVSRVVYDISGKPPATIEWE